MSSVEPAEDDPIARHHAAALMTLRVGTSGGLVLASLGVVFELAIHGVTPPVFAAAGMVVYLLVLQVLLRRNRIAGAWAGLIATCSWTIGLGLLAWCYASYELPQYTVLEAVLFLLAALHLRRSYVLSNLALGLALTFAVGFAVSGRDFVGQAVALLGVAIGTIMAYEVISRHVANLDAMRARERALERERRHLLEQLVQAQKMEAIGTLAGGIAHDMNNVLGAITNVTELVREDAPPSLHRDLDEILASARRGADLTRNLLAFSRRGNYRKERVEVGRLIGDVGRLLERTLPKRLAIATAVDDGELAIDADPSQLSQAIINLCINAADATEGQGTIEIRASRRDDATIALAVVDRGCGMTDEVRQRMFDPFFTTKPQGKGTGLGLAMVFGTVQSHRGTIEVDSEVGRGTTITLCLPLALAAAPARAPARPRSSPHLALTRVLLVDDELAIRDVVKRALEREGYLVDVAGNGREALARYREHAAALVMLDMEMPVMGGAACFAELRALDPKARVVIVSGHTRERDAEACLAAGALGFVEKPVPLRHLIEIVNVALADGDVAETIRTLTLAR